jgi:hypothetical protein
VHDRVVSVVRSATVLRARLVQYVRDRSGIANALFSGQVRASFSMQHRGNLRAERLHQTSQEVQTMRYMSGFSQPLRYHVKDASVSARVEHPYIAAHCRDSTGSARVQHGVSLSHGAVSPPTTGTDRLLGAARTSSTGGEPAGGSLTASRLWSW